MQKHQNCPWKVEIKAEGPVMGEIFWYDSNSEVNALIPHYKNTLLSKMLHTYFYVQVCKYSQENVLKVQSKSTQGSKISPVVLLSLSYILTKKQYFTAVVGQGAGLQLIITFIME